MNSIKKFLIFSSVFLLSSFLFATSASAVTLRAVENLVMTEKLLDDAYLLTGNGNIESDILGDLYIAGGSVVINGDILEDLVVAGGKVTVTGNVGGDIRLIGGQMAIYGNVGDDVLMLGGQLDLGKNSIVNGSLIAATGILTVDGMVKQDIRGGMGMLFLNGFVGRDVIVTIEDTISVSESAKIAGNLNYSALVETEIPKGTVNGKINFNKFERESFLKHVTYWFFIEKIVSFLGSILLLLIIVILAPRALTRSAEMTRSNLLKSFGIGLLSLIAIFIGSILLMTTVIAIPLALIAFSVLLMLFYFSKIFVVAWLGSYIMKYDKKFSKIKLFAVLSFCMLVYQIVNLIPFVGWAINFVLFLIGVGAIVMMKMEYMKFLRSKKMI